MSLKFRMKDSSLWFKNFIGSSLEAIWISWNYCSEFWKSLLKTFSLVMKCDRCTFFELEAVLRCWCWVLIPPLGLYNTQLKACRDYALWGLDDMLDLGLYLGEKLRVLHRTKAGCVTEQVWCLSRHFVFPNLILHLGEQSTSTQDTSTQKYFCLANYHMPFWP